MPTCVAIRAASALLAAGCLLAQPGVNELLREKTLERIREIERRSSGVVGVAAMDLATSEALVHNADTLFPQASSIKIAILAEMFAAARAGRVRLDDQLTLRPADTVGGSGHLQEALRKGPVTLTVEELLTAMVRNSDNARLAELLYRGAVVDQAASEQMIRIMKLVDADFRKAVPKSIEVAAKPGALTGVRAETGIIFLPRRPFVLSVAAAHLEGEENPVPELAAVVFDYFRKLGEANRYGRKLQ